MGLESATNIEELDSSYPLSGDPTNRGDDHLRLIKSVLKSVFPGSGGQGFSEAITATEDELNFLSGVTSAIQDQLDAITTTIQDNIYPIGAIYTTIDGTNPNSTIGFGTWEAFGEGKVLVGHDSEDPLFSTVEAEGGSKDSVLVAHEHTGTTSSNGSKNTEFKTHNDGGFGDEFTLLKPFGAGNFTGTNDITTAEDHTHTFTTSEEGVSGTNQNLQPYVVVYYWKRTA